MKLKDIARLIKGTVNGDEELEITGVSRAPDARSGDITYLSSAKFLSDVREGKASAVIVKSIDNSINKPQIVVENPELAFAILLSNFYSKPEPFSGVSSKASVSDEAVIEENVAIGDFAYIGRHAEIGCGTIIYPGVYIGDNVKIGRNCLIYPNATIREGVNIGSRVIIHSGAVIGSDGFGYVFDGREHVKIPQVGTVVIEDDVEIGANSSIDRATTGATVIGKGTKIDNLVQIGHNVTVGRGVILVSQVGIGGSSKIGDGVIIGGQAGVPDHVTIEAGAMIGAKSGIIGDIPKGVFSGSPAMPHNVFLKSSVIIRQLPEMKKRLAEIENRLNELERNIADK